MSPLPFAFTALLLVAGCGPTMPPVPTIGPTAVLKPAAAAGSLKGICPDNIVFQTNWWPEPDQGFLYQLIGPSGSVDTKRNAFVGPIGNTGVTAEVRAGGPAIGFQQVSAQLYADDSIFLGMVSTDEQIGNSANQPSKAVFAFYAKNPLIFMWGNPQWSFNSVSDVKQSGATVLAFSGAAYLDVLEGKGMLDKNQVDTAYTGDPSRFVAADGNIVSQGFVTAEPYIYEHEVQGWMRPVKFLLLHKDVPIYQDTLAIRADKFEASRACLQKLVPMLQRAAIDYVRGPGPSNAAIVDYTAKIKGGTQISLAGAADAVQKMLSLGIVENGADGVFGSYDTTRVQKLIDDFSPVYAARGKNPKPGLQPSDVITNEFLDPALRLEDRRT